MKVPVIILGGLSVLLAWLLYQKGETSGHALEAMAKEKEALTNQVLEVRTRLALSEGTASQTRSNLQYALDRRTADLNVLSNRLVQTHLLWQQSQQDGRLAGEELQARTARVAVLEAENDGLRRAAATAGGNPGVAAERELITLRQQLATVAAERDALRTQAGAAVVERQALLAKLLDTEFLERQLELAAEAADIRRRQASARAGAAPDPRQLLELQPDGSVRYAAPVAK